jgi:transcriptional regulator
VLAELYAQRMYTPEAFKETRTEVLYELIREFPLATLVMPKLGDLVINHLPMVLRPDSATRGTLVAHVPRTNAVWALMKGETRAAAVFQGPNAYITPSWYPSKHEHGRAVPTWNYAVVHVRGTPRAIDDPGWVLAHLEELTNALESRHVHPWKVSDAPQDFTDRMIGQLIGIEMPIDAIEGKWKASQNRPHADQMGVVTGLKSRGDGESLAMADLIERFAGSK